MASGLEDRRPHPGRVWNRIPDDVREEVVNLALDEPDLSPRELAVRFTDEKKHYISEASAYRILKERDLITSPAFVVVKAADEFRDKTTRPNELWRTDFTYLKIIGWGWCCLSTILDDYNRYVAHRAYAAPPGPRSLFTVAALRDHEGGGRRALVRRRSEGNGERCAGGCAGRVRLRSG